MGERVWKPGDVALIEAGCHANRKVAIRTGIPSNMGWAYSDTHNGQSTQNWTADTHGTISVVRPLVVIDPEDAEAVERLADLLRRRVMSVLTDGDMQAALRKFADPKPSCGASLALGKDAALYRCAEAEGHEGPHIDGRQTWSVQP